VVVYKSYDFKMSSISAEKLKTPMPCFEQTSKEHIIHEKKNDIKN